jgi:hypothetical protein
MRRTKVIGWGLALACSCGLMTAASASAELPELGRCVKVAPGTGGYKKPNCLPVSSTHTGEYEWLPGPGENRGFKERLSNPTFETTGGGKITCSFLFIEGEITSAKTLKVSNVTIQGCLLVGPNLSCQSTGAQKGVIESTIPLIGDLGPIPGGINPANPHLGWDLKPESGSKIIEFGCGEGKVPLETVELQGSVIGRVIKTNLMQTTFTMIYKEEHGIQIPEAFIGGEKDTLTQITTPTTNPLEPKIEQAGLKTGGELVPGEALELKAKA